MKREPHLFHTSRAEYKWSISKCVCVCGPYMYVCTCVYVYTRPYIHRHMYVCAMYVRGCVRMCTPVHTYTGTCVCARVIHWKRNSRDHTTSRNWTAHTVAAAEERETKSCCTRGAAGVPLPHQDHTHGWRITEPRKRAVPFPGEGGEYIMISVYL